MGFPHFQVHSCFHATLEHWSIGFTCFLLFLYVKANYIPLQIITVTCWIQKYTHQWNEYIVLHLFLSFHHKCYYNLFLLTQPCSIHKFTVHDIVYKPLCQLLKFKNGKCRNVMWKLFYRLLVSNDHKQDKTALTLKPKSPIFPFICTFH